MKLFGEVNQVNHKNYFVKEKTEKKKASQQSRLPQKPKGNGIKSGMWERVYSRFMP